MRTSEHSSVGGVSSNGLGRQKPRTALAHLAAKRLGGTPTQFVVSENISISTRSIDSASWSFADASHPHGVLLWPRVFFRSPRLFEP